MPIDSAQVRWLQCSTATAIAGIQSMKERNQELYRNRIMQLCLQNDVKPFLCEFPVEIFRSITYLDSGSYSFVLKCLDKESGESCAIKIIQLMPHSSRKSEQDSANLQSLMPQYYYDAFQEILISKALANLHSLTCTFKGYEFKARCFPKIYKTSLVKGPIPINSVALSSHSEYIAMCMQECGISFRKAIKQSHLNITQMVSASFQVLFGLIVAEIVYQYEHRDLHINNVLVRWTRQTNATFVIKSKSYSVPTYGIHAFIIDNTFSRMCIGQNVYYTHISHNLEKIVAKSKDPSKRLSEQDCIYVQMHQMAQNNWAKWMPRTNLLWLHYLFSQILRCRLAKIKRGNSYSAHNKLIRSFQVVTSKLKTASRLEEVLECVLTSQFVANTTSTY